jgi:hypothetical protein
MPNSNPYLILTRCRTAVIRELKDIFSPANNVAIVPPFEYNYIETAASSTLQFYGNPISGDTVTLGTDPVLLTPIVVTFVAAAPVGLQVLIGTTQQITLANLVAFINANSATLTMGATTNSIPNQLKLTSVTPGASGNSTVLSTTSKVLRFSSPTLNQGGLWDHDNSEIFIGDAIPQDYQDWPMIIVDTASASETRYLGPEDSFQAKNVFNVVTTDEIFSSLVVNINIKVYTIDDTLARDKIIDLIYNNMSEIRHQLATNGIEMIDRTLPTETRIAQNQRVYIENHFILRVYCEWSDNPAITNVSSVTVTVPLTGPVPVLNSPLFYNWVAAGTIPFSYQITALNIPTSYSAIGLPSGISVDSFNGLITGVPLATGTFYVTLQAANANGTGTLEITITIS